MVFVLSRPFQLPSAGRTPLCSSMDLRFAFEFFLFNSLPRMAVLFGFGLYSPPKFHNMFMSDLANMMRNDGPAFGPLITCRNLPRLDFAKAKVLDLAHSFFRRPCVQP